MTEIILLLFAILLCLLVALYLLHRIARAMERPPVEGIRLEVKDNPIPQPEPIQRGADPRREPRGPRTPAPVKPQSQQKRRQR